MVNPLIQTLKEPRGNPRACVYTEPLWGLSINLCLPYASVYMIALVHSQPHLDAGGGFLVFPWHFPDVSLCFEHHSVVIGPCRHSGLLPEEIKKNTAAPLTKKHFFDKMDL